MEIHNGVTYKDNYARAAAYFLATCADDSGNKGESAARKIITDIYNVIFNDASVLGWKPVEDVYFTAWEQQKGREKDIKTIRDSISKIELLIKEFFDICDEGKACDDCILTEVQPKRTLTKALCSVGCAVSDGKITLPDECAKELKKLCTVSRENIIGITDGPQEDKAYLYFSRAVFNASDNWTAKSFDRLLCADGNLISLCHELEERGYKRTDCKDGKKISLDYTKLHEKKDTPIKITWADKIHSGIEITFEELRIEPCFLWLRIPSFRTVLCHASDMNRDVSNFILSHTKTCDGCRYCVQTDKTGTRPLAAVDTEHGNKCPYFPGFTMNWRNLSSELKDMIIKTLDTVDSMTDI